MYYFNLTINKGLFAELDFHGSNLYLDHCQLRSPPHGTEMAKLYNFCFFST